MSRFIEAVQSDIAAAKAAKDASARLAEFGGNLLAEAAETYSQLSFNRVASSYCLLGKSKRGKEVTVVSLYASDEPRTARVCVHDHSQMQETFHQWDFNTESDMERGIRKGIVDFLTVLI